MFSMKTVCKLCIILWYAIFAAAKLNDDHWNNEDKTPKGDWDVWNTLIDKLNSVFEDTETSARVLFYLQQEKSQQHDDNYGPALNILLQVLNDQNLFKNFAKNLAEDTKNVEKDKGFKDYLSLIYSKMLDATQENNIEEVNTEYHENKNIQVASFYGMIRALSMMSKKNQLKMLNMIKKAVPNIMHIPTNDLVKSIKHLGNTHLTVVNLAKVHLGYEAFINIVRWWKGEISGKRAAKNIIDSFFEISGYTLGSYAGVTLGAAFGPYGTIIGGILGGILGGKASIELIDRYTLHIFDLPRSEALENAYNFFGLTKDAVNNDINKAYRQKCLQYHPDKGGSEDKFFEVQVQMSIIKAARELI
ncbi:uncharacterized protein LOC130901980 isoform X2 [Diorhabda carinulata]|nr:uncharacterized protein LOC130901980 isoform X2 [Diorhabda carinulata]